MAGSVYVSKGVKTSFLTRSFQGTRAYVRYERSDGKNAAGAGAASPANTQCLKNQSYLISLCK